MKLAQVSLSYGVDDIDGTVIEEKIYHMAGARTPQEVAREELVRAIRETGREPVQRDSLYRPVKSEEGGGKSEGADGETTATVAPLGARRGEDGAPGGRALPPAARLVAHQSPVTDHEFAGAGSEGGVA
jgi:hypothetical protein